MTSSQQQVHRDVTIRPYRTSDLNPLARLFTGSDHILAAGVYDTCQSQAWAPLTPDFNAWRQAEHALCVAGVSR